MNRQRVSPSRSGFFPLALRDSRPSIRYLLYVIATLLWFTTLELAVGAGTLAAAPPR